MLGYHTLIMANQNADPTAGLQSLLDLDGTIYEVGGGYWVSMTVGRVPPDGGRPHGIQYALSLHSPDGSRVMGYDNAHQPKIRSGPSRKSTTPLAFDHIHRGARTIPYRPKSPGDLLVDFWADVEAILTKEGVP